MKPRSFRPPFLLPTGLIVLRQDEGAPHVLGGRVRSRSTSRPSRPPSKTARWGAARSRRLRRRSRRARLESRRLRRAARRAVHRTTIKLPPRPSSPGGSIASWTPHSHWSPASDRQQLDCDPRPSAIARSATWAITSSASACRSSDAMDLGHLPRDVVRRARAARHGRRRRRRPLGRAGPRPHHRLVRGRRHSEFDRTLSIYYGPQGAHDLLERTAWHCGQHLRQLYVLAERIGIQPATPLPTDAFKGLPMPEALW